MMKWKRLRACMDAPEQTRALDSGPVLSNYNPIRADHEPLGCEARAGRVTPAFPLLLCLTVVVNLRDVYRI